MTGPDRCLALPSHRGNATDMNDKASLLLTSRFNPIGRMVMGIEEAISREIVFLREIPCVVTALEPS
jgi:hypothetical protein